MPPQNLLCQNFIFSFSDGWKLEKMLTKEHSVEEEKKSFLEEEKFKNCGGFSPTLQLSHHVTNRMKEKKIFCYCKSPCCP